jgi:hypothetical protein
MPTRSPLASGTLWPSAARGRAVPPSFRIRVTQENIVSTVSSGCDQPAPRVAGKCWRLSPSRFSRPLYSSGPARPPRPTAAHGAFLLPRGAPGPAAPPCMWQRFLPWTDGDLQGLPERVLAPQRGLEGIGPVLRL